MSQSVRTGATLRYRNEEGSASLPGSFSNATAGSQHVRVTNTTVGANAVRYLTTDINNGFTVEYVAPYTRITIPVTGMYLIECNFVATGLENVYTVIASTTGTLITIRPGAVNGTTTYQQGFMTRMVSLVANEDLIVTATPGTTVNAESWFQVTRIR